MLERLPLTQDAVLLVHIELIATDTREELAEFEELVRAANFAITEVVVSKRRQIDPKYCIGSGKAEQIKAQLAVQPATLVIVNYPLSPAQQRNLEKLWQCRVFDRTELILIIFAQRARTFEGKLQVELAQLQHQATRLVRGWTHLERQTGGIGIRGGPGESQLELDRRQLRQRVTQVKKRLEKVKAQRQLSRRARQKSAVPSISLVGYTNAGKSTLFNRLAKADVYVANKLFATLDPTLRRIYLPNERTAVLADTVGFIRHLPHELVDAFRATLEETRQADLLLHVIAADNPNHLLQAEQVRHVLAEIEADTVPVIEVYNKIDQLADAPPRVDYAADGSVKRVWISAQTGAGIDLLLQEITRQL